MRIADHHDLRRVDYAIVLAMNKMSQSATPYDLNVLSNVSVDGDSDIAAYLAAHDITISNYAKATEQISVYEADMTYSELFEGQKSNFGQL